MSLLSNQEIYQTIGQIIDQFALYQCEECAIEIIQWLKNNNLQGRILKLRTRNPREQYIISARLEKLGIMDAITDNGIHYGVEVDRLGVVFDNLSSEGMIREDWLQDFLCPSNQFILETFDFY